MVPFTRVKITKHFFTMFPKEKNQKVFPPVKQMCLAGTQHSNLSQRSQDKNKVILVHQTHPLNLLLSLFLLIDRSVWLGTGRWDKNVLKRNFCQHVFHLELVAEAADRNPTSKGDIWTLIKSCHSLIAFPKAENHPKLEFFIRSSEKMTIKPFSL